jgi:hypothetical protein
MSTPNLPPQKLMGTPVYSYSRSVYSSSTSNQSDSLQDAARIAVLEDLGSCVPQVKFEDFMEHLAPPIPSFNLIATMRDLKSGRQPFLTASGWKAFEKEPKAQGGKEDAVFQPISIIFEAVVNAIIKGRNSTLTENNRSIDFVQNPNLAPISAEMEKNVSRPDGAMVLKSRKGENVLWADIVLSCEYQIKDGKEQLDDVRASWRS